MSASFTPSRDLIPGAGSSAGESLFTTFATGHFVRPGPSIQPVRSIAAMSRPVTFAGCYCEVFAAPPIDLDYDEPHEVVAAELELVAPGSPVHQMVLESPGDSAGNKTRRPAA